MDTPNPQPSQSTPSTPDATRLQQVGTIAAILITTMFVGAWVTRGVLERKAPSFFEVAFAASTAVTALTDPKAVANLPLKILDRGD